MRPHAQHSASKTVARARMFIQAHLAWMDGYPVGADEGTVRWRRVGEDEELEIDRELLRQATYTLTKLRNRFPQALPRLVGNVEAWEDRHRTLLEALKPTVHQGAPLPESLFESPDYFDHKTRRAAAALVGHCPALAPIVAALSWICCGKAARARRALAWFTRNCVELGELTGRVPDPISLHLGLWLLVETEGARRVTPVLDRLAAPRCFELPIENSGRYRNDLSTALTRARRVTGATLQPKRPTETLGPHVAAWLVGLVELEPLARRRALRLLEVTWPTQGLDAWERWWRSHDRVLSAVRRALGPRQPAALSGPTREKLQQRLDKLVEATPATIPTTRWLGAVTSQATGADEARHRSLFRVLSRVTGPVVLPAMMLVDLDRLSRSNPKSVDWLLRSLGRFLAHPHFVEDWTRPWYPLAGWAERWHHSINEEVLETFDAPVRIESFFDALVEVRLAFGPLDEDQADDLLDLLEVTDDVKRCVAYYGALRERGAERQWLPRNAARATDLLAAGDAATYLQLRQAWSNIEGEYTDTDAAGLLEAVQLFAAAGRLEEMRSVALAGHFQRIARAGVLAGLARKNKLSIPAPRAEPTTESAEWLKPYPPHLHDALRGLAEGHPRPQEAAARILGRDFPAPGSLAAEIESLDGRITEADAGRAAGMKKRVLALRQRLNNPRPVSAARLERLRIKLEFAAALAVFETWTAALDDLLRSTLPRKLPIDPTWLDRPELREVLAGIGELPTAQRNLALELLRVRRGPPPWDLRDHSANLTFLDHLRGLGIDPEPWVEGIGELTRRIGEVTLTLSLENDPLEIFLMGAHFRTCLAPGAMNFFAVFANAADINKRVLYARAKGTVKGRCLLALDSSGSLVAFHPYCHDRSLGFEEMVAQVCRNLADRMGTSLGKRTPIPKLVAGDWYDDGAVAIAGLNGPFDQGSALRGALPTVELHSLLGVLTAALAPSELDEHALLAVLHLPELSERPELVMPLLHLVERDGRLPDATVVHAARLAFRAGNPSAAARLYCGRLVPVLRQSFREHGWMDPELLDLLQATDAGAALRLLRQTRARGVRRWDDEVDVDRLYIGARAMEALHRPRQALALYHRALNEGAQGDLANLCRERLHALEVR